MFKGKDELGLAFLPEKFHGQRSLVDYSQSMVLQKSQTGLRN